jgi:hypothetical protein
MVPKKGLLSTISHPIPLPPSGKQKGRNIALSVLYLHYLSLDFFPTPFQPLPELSKSSKTCVRSAWSTDGDLFTVYFKFA